MWYGPTGIPQKALFPLWGECSWNAYGTFYYMSGMIGYLLLGLYFRRFLPDLSWKKTLGAALPLWMGGFAITFGGFLRRVLATGSFPLSEGLGTAVAWETTWNFDTFGVAIMTIGTVLLFRKITASGAFYQRVLLPVSKASYGMYLCHMVFLSAISGWFRGWLGLGLDGRLGIWTTPVQILATGICSFLCVALFSVLVARIPKAGKYIMG